MGPAAWPRPGVGPAAWPRRGVGRPPGAAWGAAPGAADTDGTCGPPAAHAAPSPEARPQAHLAPSPEARCAVARRATGTQTESSSLRGQRSAALEVFGLACANALLEEVVEGEVSAIIGACLSDTVADALQRSQHVQRPPGVRPDPHDPYAGLDDWLGKLGEAAGPVRASWRPRRDDRKGSRRVDFAQARKPKR